MIRHSQPEVFNVHTSADHVRIAAANAGVEVTVVDGEHVALVPIPIGVLRYSAPVRMGDIGEPVRHIEFEPFPTTAPAEPSVAPTPEEVPA